MLSNTCTGLYAALLYVCVCVCVCVCGVCGVWGVCVVHDTHTTHTQQVIICRHNTDNFCTDTHS
jgi:hypothetical protein